MTTAATYDPASNVDRRELAVALHRALASRRFAIKGCKADGGEIVYRREAADGIDVLVYSSINWATGQVAGDGKDAIRVCAVYTNKAGESRGLARDKRVNRTGNIEAIIGRVMTRAKGVFESVASRHTCRCGAPKFTSKKGNLVCADVCWTK